MAIEVLTNADHSSIIQKPKHDLESIFYVLLCFCIRYNGPRGSKAVYEEELPLDKWYLANQSYDSLAISKTGTLYEFENRVMRFIPPYFNNLKSCLYQLFNCVFMPHSYLTQEGETRSLRAFSSNNATHATMLKVLENVVTELPDDDQWSAVPQPMRAPGLSTLRHVATGLEFRSGTSSRDGGTRRSGKKGGGVSRTSGQHDLGSIGQDTGDAGPSSARSRSTNRSGGPVTTGKRRGGEPVTVMPNGDTAASTSSASSTSKKRRV